jgi:hypothetical protein
MRIKFSEIPGWTFEIDEISAGVYKVTGKDDCQRSIERTGTHPDAVLDECKQYALTGESLRSQY